ncbi:MAG: HAD family hydrolase, partial [bacterium]
SEDQSSEDWIEPFRDIYRDVCVEHVQPYDGIESWLDYLGPRRALVTNKPLSMTNPILEKLGWEHLFDRVLGPSSVEQPKPHPQPLELVMKHWDTDPSEVVMVGDNWTDIKAGKQAGTVTAGCLYGLGHTEQLREQSPDHLINSPSELFELV